VNAQRTAPLTAQPLELATHTWPLPDRAQAVRSTRSCMSACACVHACACACADAHANAHAHARIHARTHARTHARMQARAGEGCVGRGGLDFLRMLSPIGMSCNRETTTCTASKLPSRTLQCASMTCDGHCDHSKHSEPNLYCTRTFRVHTVVLFLVSIARSETWQCRLLKQTYT
jgi:hypothetical protein